MRAVRRVGSSGCRKARARARRPGADEYAAALPRRRWLAGALGTLIAVALGKWAFVHAGYALVDRLRFCPMWRSHFGVPLAAFALVAAVVLHRHATPAYTRNAAHVDRLRERSVR